MCIYIYICMYIYIYNPTPIVPGLYASRAVEPIGLTPCLVRCALAFTRYCFTSKLYCGSRSSSYPPYLQSLRCCNTIARPLRNIRPPTDPPVVCHTPYNIGDCNIV